MTGAASPWKLIRRSPVQVGQNRRSGWTGVLTPSAILVGSAACAGAVNFAFGLLVARLAGETTWSAVAPMLAAGTAGSFAGLGLEYAVTRAIVGGEPWWRSLRRALPLASALLVAVAVSVLVAAPLARFLHLGSSAPVPLCVGLFAVTVLSAAPVGLLVGRRRIGMLAITGVAAAAARIGFLWVVPGSWVERALWCSIASVVLGALAMLLVGARGPERRQREATGFGKFGLSGSVAQVVLWLTVIAPVVVARHFLPLRAAGELATVTFIASSLAYLAGPVATTFFPVMLVDPHRRHLRNGLAVSGGIVVLGTAGMVLAGPTLLRVLYHTRQPHLTLLLLFGGLSVLVQTVSGFLVWAALARNNAVRSVLAASLGAVPLVGLLWLWHSSAAALLVAALPSTAVLGLVCGVRGLGLRTGSVCKLFSRFTTSTAEQSFDKPSTSGVSCRDDYVPLSSCSVGVMAHNEELTIRECLGSLLKTEDRLGEKVHEVIVVVSGNDATEKIASEIATFDCRVRVIRQTGTWGKAAAVNMFIEQAEKDILVLSSADVLLGEGMLSGLVAPLEDAQVGMCGGEIRPTNPGRGLCNRLVHLMWELHSMVARRRPKLGEIVAFRRCFQAIDVRSTADEVSIEAGVEATGLSLVYLPGVRVYNHGPTRIRDFVHHRYRCHRAHLAVRHKTGYKAATLSPRNVLPQVGLMAARRPWRLALLSLAAVLEAMARIWANAAQLALGVPETRQWARITSAKTSFTVPESRKDAAVGGGTLQEKPAV